MRSASSLSTYFGYTALKLDKASDREGRDSWFVKWMLGNRDTVAMEKSKHEDLVVLAG